MNDRDARYSGMWSLTAAALLLLMFALAVHSLVQKSPTFDEQGFLVRGLGYLRGENRHMRVGHPLGLNALNAALLVRDDNVRLPVDDPSWQETSFHRPAELFLWEIGNDVAHVMFLARLPTVWLGMLLAALAGRWAAQMSGRNGAGLLVLVLVALDPNVLAHTRLVTTDLGLAAGATVAGYTLWRFLRRPGWGSAVWAGVGLGLLQNTKFTALLFLPLFALVVAVVWWMRRRRGRATSQLLLSLLLIYPAVAVLTLWAAYGFEVGTLPAELPTLPQLAGRTLPLAHHLEQLLDIGGRVQRSTTSFLFGRYSESGWWYYFPVAFLLKTPLPTLLLLAWAGWRFVRRRVGLTALDTTALLIPAGGYFAAAMTTDINIGYRHLLPVLPFLYVFAGTVVVGGRWQAAGGGWRTGGSRTAPTDNRRTAGDPLTINYSPIQQLIIRLAPWLLVTWLGILSLWIAPDFLAYFNVLAGGPENGWRALVDSNLDWGQDLQGLAAWQRENGREPLWLSYFGEARPEYYGLEYRGLDSFPPRLMNPQARPFYPADPAPGLYAISATNLQGVLFQNHEQFAWFREREPLEKIGYSIFLYRVPARGAGAALALGGLQVDEMAPADYAQLGTNDVTLRWFDPAQALLLPAADAAWLGLRAGEPAAFMGLLAEVGELVLQNEGYALYRLEAGRPEAVRSFMGDGRLPEAFMDAGPGHIRLEGTQAPTTGRAGEEFVLHTAWTQQGETRPVNIFVHLLDGQGELVAQWDGLGAVAEGWRAGDWLVQQHVIPLPEALPAGRYTVVTGLYDPETVVRWQTAAGTDSVLLGEVEISDG